MAVAADILLETLGIKNLADAPPGPTGMKLLSSSLNFMDDQVEFMRQIQTEYGDFARFRLGSFVNYLVSDPDAIHEILVTKADSFQKDKITHELEDILGHGLLTSEGDFWRRQRKLAAPALKRKQISSYADAMVDITKREASSWADGEVLELHGVVSHLAMEIVVKTLFNLNTGPELDQVGEAVETAMMHFHRMTHTFWRFLPDGIPTPAQDRFNNAMASLDEVVYRLIDDRRMDQVEGDDLLYRFLVANDEEGNQMTDQQLRDEVITIFMAGHETTALVISYTWYMLTLHPDVSERLYEEVDRILGKRDATFEDSLAMPYTTAVIKETMRLYPPAWIFGREAVEDVQIGDYLIPKSTQILIGQVIMHTKEEYFEDPYDFRPERWLDPEFEKSLPRHVYLPFGGGARVCIGNHFAMMEAILVVATMAQQVRLKNRMTDVLKLQPAVTLRPITPIRMAVEQR